jgi:mannosyltransferase OCH1-like enzyme
MINKIIHQIWVGKYPLPERETRLSKEIKEKHTNYEYHLWTDDNLPDIPERLKDMYELMYSKKDYVYCADMLRWLVVYQYGGWYLDIDWECNTFINIWIIFIFFTVLSQCKEKMSTHKSCGNWCI